MELNDIFREKYRKTRDYACSGDLENTMSSMDEICKLLANQIEKNNGDSILTKAKLKKWKDTFEAYLSIIKQNGLTDVRIKKLFGFETFSERPKAAGGGDKKVGDGNSDNFGGIDIAGLMPEDDGTPEPKTSEPSIEGIGPGVPSTEDTPKATMIEPPPIKVEPTYPKLEGNEPELAGFGGSDYSGEEDNGVPSFEPKSLKTFIGQQHIVKVLLKEIAIAKAEGRRHLDNILLFGNPGLGKSTLMELIAKELGVRFEMLDCSQFQDSRKSLVGLQNFFMNIAKSNEPVVIALDEVHMLSRDLQSSLLTLLNSRVYVSPLDKNGNSQRIEIKEFTFIAATTDDDKVLDTIKNRCLRLTFQMVDYTDDELRQIYKNKVASKGLTITDEAIDVCIPRSRGAMRYVNSIVEGLNTARYNDAGVVLTNHIDLELAVNYFKDKEIDAMGLGKKDIEILKAIDDNGCDPISADVLSARVGLETKKYLSEYERYLIKIGFISVSGRGRSLTEKAREYLKNTHNKNEPNIETGNDNNVNEGLSGDTSGETNSDNYVNNIEPEENNTTGENNAENVETE